MSRVLVAMICVCGSCAVVCAADSTAVTNSLPDKARIEEFKKFIADVRMKKTGGLIRKDGSAKGRFVLLNGQKSVDRKELVAALATLDRQLKVRTEVVACDGIDTGNVRKTIEKSGGSVGVALVESPSLPSLLAAPESGWAIVNVSALSVEGDAGALASRVRKEILRGFAFIAGGCYSLFGDFLMRDVTEPRQLDAVANEEFSIALIQRMSQVLPNYGITPWYETTYQRACEEGWAPQPTNEYQKAIWDKVHSIPQKPIKIEYNEKRDKGK